MTERYLYVFEAKEIQKFILHSDKLKEMVGGSEIVSLLCDGFLEESLAVLGINEKDHKIIANAAGWARILFENENQMKSFFAHWPLLAAQFAPGLQIIQGVAAFESDDEIPAALDSTNKQLLRERNIVMQSLPEITPLIERNPRTGLAAIKNGKHDGKLDRQAVRKRDYKGENLTVSGLIVKGTGQTWPEKFDKIVDDDNAYLAIIHADGNDLGSTLMKLREHVKKTGTNAVDTFKQFSNVIAEATLIAAQSAFEAVLNPAANERSDKVIPARPIVLGGDDLTIIVRADLACDFTSCFLREFESQSANLLRTNLSGINGLPQKLTACAGISFVKKAYPFVHGYDLAESLCDYTKRIAKEKKYELANDISGIQYIPSSFAFHRNTSSISATFGEVQKKELTSRDRTIKFYFGPYAAVADYSGDLPTFDKLEALANALRRIPGGSVRELIADLYIDGNLAKTRFERILQMAKDDAEVELKNALNSLMSGGNSPYLNRENQTPLCDAYNLNSLTVSIEEESDENC